MSMEIMEVGLYCTEETLAWWQRCPYYVSRDLLTMPRAEFIQAKLLSVESY
jgi:hypothetical protein